jgi:hypothetical protein
VFMEVIDRGLIKRSRLITFNTKITHLSDVLCSSQEERGRLEKTQLTRSVAARKPAHRIDGRFYGTGRASSATGYLSH